MRTLLAWLLMCVPLAAQELQPVNYPFASQQAQCPGGVCNPQQIQSRLIPITTQPWKWIPLEKHHGAVIRVRMDQPGREKRAGTAVVVWTDGQTAIALTARHVAQGASQGLLTWTSGKTATATVVGSGDTADLSVLQFSPPGPVVVIPPATEPPPIGATVEVLGWGGPSGYGLRRFHSHVVSTGDQLAIDQPIIDGDSGGAVVYQQRLAGILWGGTPSGRVMVSGGQQWMLVTPAQAYTCRPIRNLLGRFFPRACQPSVAIDIRPNIPPPVPGLPVLNPPIVDVQPPQCPVPPTAAEIAAELKKDAAFIASLKGADGVNGKDGLPGKDGVDGNDGSVANIDTDALVLRISELLKTDSEFVALTKGEKGNPGRDGANGIDGQDGSSGKDGPPGDISSLDIDALLVNLEKRLKPIRIQTLNADGSVHDDVIARLGDLVRIRSLAVQKTKGE